MAFGAYPSRKDFFNQRLWAGCAATIGRRTGATSHHVLQIGLKGCARQALDGIGKLSANHLRLGVWQRKQTIAHRHIEPMTALAITFEDKGAKTDVAGIRMMAIGTDQVFYAVGPTHSFSFKMQIVREKQAGVVLRTVLYRDAFQASRIPVDARHRRPETGVGVKGIDRKHIGHSGEILWRSMTVDAGMRTLRQYGMGIAMLSVATRTALTVHFPQSHQLCLITMVRDPLMAIQTRTVLHTHEETFMTGGAITGEMLMAVAEDAGTPPLIARQDSLHHWRCGDAAHDQRNEQSQQ
ncbi:hypothetical protein [Algiphilus sp.]|uniref:hypothetical protein n=1 Tax=Algiphilus sp. TaxID=1872431 RepID=UPI0032EEAD9A